MKKTKAGTKFLLFALLISGSVSLSAQTTRINSPYTLFGIGNLNNNNVNARSFSMGGIKYGWRESNLINMANPASYTAFDTLSFLFEGSLFADFVTLKSKDLSQQSNSASLNYLTFGFPVAKWWKSSFGLLPFSNVGYVVSEDKVLPDIGLVRYTNDGSGGFNQVYLGNGFQITKNLSLGLNIAYVYGMIDRGTSVNFPDSLFYFSSRFDNSYEANDFIFTYGLQYTKPLKNDMDITLGLTFSNTTKLTARKDYLVRSFYGEQSDIKFFRDTIDYAGDQKGELIIPKSIGAGIVLKKHDKWLVGADISWQNWEEFKAFGQSDSLRNRLNLAIGAQYTPNKYSIFSYWERMDYRMGLRYANTYLDLNGNQLKEFGISFGLGFPVWKSKSTMNVGVEFGRWGTTKDDLVQENYIKFIFAVSIYENWFIKPKYR